MRPGPPAVCAGSVLHRRNRPRHHEFRYAVHYVWFDPDRPDDLCDLHSAWSSTRRWAPVRFRRADYGDGSATPLGDQVRHRLAPVLGRRPAGPVRLLTQLRRWGWLFNPISVFVVWDDPEADPVGAVLEVTNTPWKERHHYAIELSPEPTGPGFVAEFDKALHVSPFLDEDYRYRFGLAADDDGIDLRLDVVAHGAAVPGEPIVETRLRTGRRSADHDTLAADLLGAFAPTHRVSLGIHLEAARLLAKRVPFIPHPRRPTPSEPAASPSASPTPTTTGSPR